MRVLARAAFLLCENVPVRLESDDFAGNSLVARFVERSDGREGCNQQSETIDKLMPCHTSRSLDPVESMTD